MERLVARSVGRLVHKSRLKISRYTMGEGGREEENEVSGNCTANGLNKGQREREREGGRGRSSNLGIEVLRIKLPLLRIRQLSDRKSTR